MTQSLIKDGSYDTSQADIPNSVDPAVPSEWRFCADRRSTLHSNHTSHPSNLFYAPNPVHENAPSPNEADLGDLPAPDYSIDCETVDDLVELIQLILSYHAFYKYGAHLFGITGLKEVDQRVRAMMLKLQATVSHGKGARWCISKFHDILHMPMDMQSFGCSENIDTSKGEHGLQLWAKLPSRTTQTTHGANKFIEQLATRLYEQTLIDKAYSVVVPLSSSLPQRKRCVLEVPNFAIDTLRKSSFRINSAFKRHKFQNIELDAKLINWFCSKQNKVIKRQGVNVYSRLFLETFNNLTFRASPDYLGTGPWYDWVLVQFVDDHDNELHYAFKIMGFVNKDDGGSGPICFGQICTTQQRTK